MTVSVPGANLASPSDRHRPRRSATGCTVPGASTRTRHERSSARSAQRRSPGPAQTVAARAAGRSPEELTSAEGDSTPAVQSDLASCKSVRATATRRRRVQILLRCRHGIRSVGVASRIPVYFPMPPTNWLSPSLLTPLNTASGKDSSVSATRPSTRLLSRNRQELCTHRPRSQT